MSSSKPQRSVEVIDKPGHMLLAEGHASTFQEGDELVRLLQKEACNNPAEEVRSYLKRHAQAMGQRDISKFRYELYVEASKLETHVLAERLEKLMRATWLVRGHLVAADN